MKNILKILGEKFTMTKIDKCIEIVTEAYQKDDAPWYLAFSGGKDSTCVLKIIYQALLAMPFHKKYVYIVYCDTGVEMPCIRESVLKTLRLLEEEAKADKIPIRVIIASPNLNDRFFVNVLGKGYMPPSFLFRWCTERLRIKPLQEVINKDIANIVILGTRKDESQERNKVLKKYQINEYYFKQTNYPNSIIFSPIINFSVKDVWVCIESLAKPFAIDTKELEFLYEGIKGGLTDNHISQKGRYGCWTCTVVRKDMAGEKLFEKGYTEMKELLGYRQLLLDMKSDMYYREKKRRNGTEGKGPYTIEARKILLNKLVQIQKDIRLQLITEEEVLLIEQLWIKDCEMADVKNCLSI